MIRGIRTYVYVTGNLYFQVLQFHMLPITAGSKIRMHHAAKT